jgi:hypothetical protein
MGSIQKGTKSISGYFSRYLVNRYTLLSGGIGIVLLVIFPSYIKGFLTLIVLAAFGSFSTYYKRKLENFGAIGFEFVTFTTVLVGVAFGPLVGALFGFAVSLTSVVLSRDIGVTTPIFLIATAAIGTAAQTLSNHIGIIPLGMLALFFSAIAVNFFTFFVQPDMEMKIVTGTGVVVNFIANYIILTNLAKPILAFLV